MSKPVTNLIVALVLMLPSIMLNGWVASIIWGWYVVSTMGLPTVPIPVWIGVSFIIGLYRNPTEPDKNKQIDTAEIVGRMIGGPLAILGFTWLLKLILL